MIKRMVVNFLTTLIIGASAGIACAQEAPKASLFNFGELTHQLRAGYSVDQHGQVSDVYYASILSVHNRAAIDLFTLNLGYIGAKKRPTIMMGMRVDNMIPLLFNGQWGKSHVSVAKMPTFECGPFVSAWPKENSNFWDMAVTYGLGAAVGF